MKKAHISLLGLAAAIPFLVAQAVTPVTPLIGKIIALDAGHGSSESDTGATNDINGIAITEADLNFDVVTALAVKLTGQGAHVVIAWRFPARRDRVNDAVAKCAALDVDGVVGADNRKCDVLVSVHHNGNIEPMHDGTLTIYTQNSDKPLAKALYDSLLPLTNKPEGMLNGGYGMTVYKNLVSTITEAYYITNDCEAELYLYSRGQLADISQSCKNSGYTLENRIDREAGLQVEGLSNYFSSQTGGKGGRK